MKANHPYLLIYIYIQGLQTCCTDLGFGVHGFSVPGLWSSAGSLMRVATFVEQVEVGRVGLPPALRCSTQERNKLGLRTIRRGEGLVSMTFPTTNKEPGEEKRTERKKSQS